MEEGRKWSVWDGFGVEANKIYEYKIDYMKIQVMLLRVLCQTKQDFGLAQLKLYLYHQHFCLKSSFKNEWFLNTCWSFFFFPQ